MQKTLEELQNGNPLAFEKLFDQFYEPLCKYAYTILRDMDDAEDVVQSTFFKLWDQRHTLSIESSLNSYIYRIVHNNSINIIRQQSNHQEHNENWLKTATKELNTTIEDIEAKELQSAINQALENLPPQCKKVFMMSRMDQMAYSEIAKELNISPKTVENHIAKALKLLRVDLQEFLTAYLLFCLLKQMP